MVSWATVRRLMPPPPMLPGETWGHYAGMSADEWRERTGEAWAQRRVERFPLSWITVLMRRWRVKHEASALEANEAMRKTAATITAAQAAGVQPDASDADLVREAAAAARATEQMLLERDARTRQRRTPAGDPWPEGVCLLALWDKVHSWLETLGLAAHAMRARGLISSWLRRVVDERWWRRILRRLHAQAVEATARTLGLVSKRAGCYVSDDGLRMRTGQRARNERALKAVVMVNDAGQEFELAELAAKGVSNREVRRCELMTRIAGFEVIARQCGHEALFVTMTCPSKMHAVRTTAGGGVEDNPSFDGTTPGAAQRYLSDQWAKFRAACDRRGVQLYGFRIAEPNHDATPHWHCLLFFPPMAVHPERKRAARGVGVAEGAQPVGRVRGAVRVVVQQLRKYFLWSAGRDVERGARKHRVKVERIDWSRGSAAGYIAKYVAKNIDGYRVEKDLYGNDTITSSRRVDAWASIHRIRQFQQIGGAPVGVWRELRRLHPDTAAASETVAAMVEAVNVSSDAQAEAEGTGNDIKHQRTAAHGWATYLELQGGHRVRRKDLRVRVLSEVTGELGRYGDPLAPRPVGVITTEVARESVRVGIVSMTRIVKVTHQVETERSSWVQVVRGVAAAVAWRISVDTDTKPPGRGHCEWPGSDPGPARQGQGEGGAAVLPPWSSVNNCTRPPGWAEEAPAPLFAPTVRRTRKVGRWHAWGRPAVDVEQRQDGRGGTGDG